MTMTLDEMLEKARERADQADRCRPSVNSGLLTVMATQYQVGAELYRLQIETNKRLDTLIAQGKAQPDRANSDECYFVFNGGKRCYLAPDHQGLHWPGPDETPQGQSVAENLAGMQEYVRELELASRMILKEWRGIEDSSTINWELDQAMIMLRRVLHGKSTQAAESSPGEEG